MNIFNFDIHSFVGFMMVFVRMSGIIFTMPILGSSSVPPHARVGIAAVTAYLIYLATPLPPADVEMPMGRLVLVLAGELAVGLTIGFATQLIFTAIQLAGQITGFQMGFAIVNVMDPITNTQVSVTSNFQNIIALLIFLGMNGHHWLLLASAKSFEMIPVMGFSPEGGLVDIMTTLTKNVFVTAIKIAAPIMATLFFLNVALGLIARTVPQMNVFIVGFPLQISLGLFMMGATAPIFLYLFQNSFMDMYMGIFALMNMM